MKTDWRLHGTDYSVDVRRSSQSGDDTVYLYIDAGLSGARLSIPVEQAKMIMRAFDAELKVAA